MRTIGRKGALKTEESIVDPEELQGMDERNTLWVRAWKRACSGAFEVMTRPQRRLKK